LTARRIKRTRAATLNRQPELILGPDAPGQHTGGCEPPRETEGLLRDLDRRLRGRFAHLTGGQSPWAALQAWEDWYFHLSVSPARQIELWWRWSETLQALAAGAGAGERDDWTFQPEPGDRRFRSPGWSRSPYRLLAQSHLAAEAQWRAATSCLRGVAAHHARRVAFMGSSILNAVAPVNFPWSNPDVLDATLASNGQNFLRGMRNFWKDIAAQGGHFRPQDRPSWRVGETMATTEGHVVYRNDLFELIQYAPASATVHPEPVFIVPAWIMKYYILDIRPEDSFVRWLVSQGFTVFIVSWKNPGTGLRDTGFDDYRRYGVMEALSIVQKTCGGAVVHGVGYCLGGTILAIAAAAMGRSDDNRLASLTLLAAQTDFREAGELLLFIDESQVALLEDMMHIDGTLDARNMASAFSILRAHELVYSRLVERYMLGHLAEPGPIESWLSDPTRMPARMHSEYLRKLFMENSFTHGELSVEGEFVAVKDIRVPVFALGAERDHIAPWRSVYRIGLHGSAETTFVLTGGGHNTSVVSPPGKPGAYFYAGPTIGGRTYLEPDAWLARARRGDGSWWPEWLSWLKKRSGSGRAVRPPHPQDILGSAPGTYVLET
jgi:polyhydroxyalkanoate synthase